MSASSRRAVFDKAFKGLGALNGLDLRVPKGSIFGVLGRSGARNGRALSRLSQRDLSST